MENGVDNSELQHFIIKAIYEASPNGILVVNDKQIIVSHNRRFVDLWAIPNYLLKGSEPGTAIGLHDGPILASVLARVKDADAFLAQVKALYDDPYLSDSCEIELLDGRTLERHSTVLFSETGRHLGRVWFFRDMTNQKQAEATLKELTRQDPLTGVANRRYFFERANQEFARTQRYSTDLSIVVLDIDYFKRINDQNGHAVGDEVLKSVCSISQLRLRKMDIFARIGGEEFALLLPETDLDCASRLAERIRRAIAGNNLLLNNGEFINCTISLGIAMLRGTDTCVEDCLSRADNAMYRAKQNGRNRIEMDF